MHRSDLDTDPIWQPDAARIAGANITAYQQWLEQRLQRRFDSYHALWQWSCDEPDAFWLSIWDWFAVVSPAPPGPVRTGQGMPGTRWFDQAQVNYAAQILSKARPGQPAIIEEDELGHTVTVSWDELQQQVGCLARTLTDRGVAPGDRVCAWLPNRHQTIVAFLACASIGAIWSLCSPDMGSLAVLDRFSQIQPRVLIACDGYRYSGKWHDRRAVLAELVNGLPELDTLILVPLLPGADDRTPLLPNCLDWHTAITAAQPLAPQWLPFNHPLWVVYSSGTTGTPKAIVHGHGGMLLSMSSMLGLHNDLGPEDRYHWYSATGWIMWNCQMAGLLVGSTVCIYDGNPGAPDLGALWRFAGRHRITLFGAGAAFYASCIKAGIDPNAQADLGALRTVGSTGSPLSPEAYHWIYRHVGNGNIWLTPMSGGTDLAGPFIAGVPTLPVYLGEMQCRVLGASVHAFNDDGQAVIDDVGELVCIDPMPAMPLFFWNDADGSRYKESYFDTWEGIWRHGDWIRITPRGGAIIYGRSDATINRHGIRMGTAELYRAVEAIDAVLDCLVVDLEYLGKPSWMPLFVVLRPGTAPDEGLRAQINDRIRQALSARHVPNTIIAVQDIPRTLSGKRLELPVKKLLLGQPASKVVNRDAMANPQCMDWYEAFAARHLARQADATTDSVL